MRPLKLTMKAFGPYAEMETIDFTKLGNRTMFVISGKTGSGKTTIFDAISYAIYGKASGEDRNGSDLRSQFAHNETQTEVLLDFSLRGKIYSISRSPQQQKKKERGDGFTTIPAKAELYIWEETGTKKLLASKINDVEEKVKEIMQIDSNQFRQIMMIPQGEFRKLLTSDSKDKEIILQRLFHTQIYKLVEEKLKNEVNDLKNKIAEQVQARYEAIRRIQVVENDELRNCLESDNLNELVILPLLKAEICSMNELIEKYNISLKEKIIVQDHLKAQLFEAETILKQLQLKEELTIKKAELDGQASSIIEKDKKVKMAQKAALLAKQEELCHRLKREADLLEREVTSLKTEADKLDTLAAENESQLQRESEREPERQAGLEEMNRLTNIKEDVYSYAAFVKEVGSVEASLKDAKEKQEVAQKELLLTEAKLKELNQQKGKIEEAQLSYLQNERKLEKLQIELDQLQKYNKLLDEQQKAEHDFKRSKEKYEHTTARYQDAKELVDEMEKRWLRGQAAVLAAKLQNGVACPVCGSEHHPAPAFYHEDTMANEADLKAAKQQVFILEKEKSKAESAFYDSQSVFRREQDALKEIYKEILLHRPDFTEGHLPNVIAEIRTAVNSLINTQKSLSEQNKLLDLVRKELEHKESDKIALQQTVQQLATEVNQWTVHFTEKKTNLTRMKEAIPENLRTENEFEKVLAAAKRKYEGLLQQFEDAKKLFQNVKEKQTAAKARLVDAVKHHVTKNNELESEREYFKQQMIEQGFENYRLYEASKRAEEEIRSLEKEIRMYHEELRSVSDRLNELTELLKDVKAPDIEGLKSSLNQVLAEIEDLNQKKTDLYMKKRDNEEISNFVSGLNGQIKKLEEKYQLIGQLYDITRGQNTHRITFERYVLAAFLDDILREANVRLRKMTAGRFQLLRKTDRSKGNIQSGLELLVFDQYTGQERHVKTLSGGESFKASLSLALGLADVVQNYSGGVSLETMFIDEGFGTLDPESLDQAVESLMDIQSTGRLVGIISHVPELKERIDVSLEVTAGQNGSHTEFVFTN